MMSKRLKLIGKLPESENELTFGHLLRVVDQHQHAELVRIDWFGKWGFRCSLLNKPVAHFEEFESVKEWLVGVGQVLFPDFWVSPF